MNQQLQFFSEQEKEQKVTEHYVVLDVETRFSAQEVGGWSNAQAMGVSIAVSYNSKTDSFTWYEQKDIPALAKELSEASKVIGFNTVNFDYHVLQPHAKTCNFSRLPSVDLLLCIQAALGFRVSLESAASATLNAPKSANGLLALEWWQQGLLDKIGHYCQQDVQLTKDLYLYGKEHGHILYTKKNGARAKVQALW